MATIAKQIESTYKTFTGLKPTALETSIVSTQYAPGTSFMIGGQGYVKTETGQVIPVSKAGVAVSGISGIAGQPVSVAPPRVEAPPIKETPTTAMLKTGEAVSIKELERKPELAFTGFEDVYTALMVGRASKEYREYKALQEKQNLEALKIEASVKSLQSERTELEQKVGVGAGQVWYANQVKAYNEKVEQINEKVERLEEKQKKISEKFEALQEKQKKEKAEPSFFALTKEQEKEYGQMLLRGQYDVRKSMPLGFQEQIKVATPFAMEKQRELLMVPVEMPLEFAGKTGEIWGEYFFRPTFYVPAQTATEIVMGKPVSWAEFERRILKPTEYEKMAARGAGRTGVEIAMLLAPSGVGVTTRTAAMARAGSVEAFLLGGGFAVGGKGVGAISRGVKATLGTGKALKAYAITEKAIGKAVIPAFFGYEALKAGTVLPEAMRARDYEQYKQESARIAGELGGFVTGMQAGARVPLGAAEPVLFRAGERVGEFGKLPKEFAVGLEKEFQPQTRFVQENFPRIVIAQQNYLDMVQSFELPKMKPLKVSLEKPEKIVIAEQALLDAHQRLKLPKIELPKIKKPERITKAEQAFLDVFQELKPPKVMKKIVLEKPFTAKQKRALLSLQAEYFKKELVAEMAPKKIVVREPKPPLTPRQELIRQERMLADTERMAKRIAERNLKFAEVKELKKLHPIPKMDVPVFKYKIRKPVMAMLKAKEVGQKIKSAFKEFFAEKRVLTAEQKEMKAKWEESNVLARRLVGEEAEQLKLLEPKKLTARQELLQLERAQARIEREVAKRDKEILELQEKYPRFKMAKEIKKEYPAVKEIPFQRQIMVQITKQKPIEETKLRELRRIGFKPFAWVKEPMPTKAERQRQKELQSLYATEKQLQKQFQKQLVMPIEKIAHATRAITLTAVKTITAPIEKMKPLELVKITPAKAERITSLEIEKMKPIEPPHPPPFLLLPKKLFAREKPLPERKEKGYHAYVKEKGRWLKATEQPLPRESALTVGGTIADEYTARSFRIKQARQRVEPEPSTAWPALSKKFYAGKQGYTEKTKYAIDSFSEILGIPYKGRAKLKRMKEMGIPIRKSTRRQQRREMRRLIYGR